MSGPDSKKTVAKGKLKAEGSGQDEPEWASGLKRLYDGVVSEPLPDSFMDLLAKLDDGSGKK